MFKGVLCYSNCRWLHYSPYQPGGAGQYTGVGRHIGTVSPGCEKKDSELQQTDCRLHVIAAVFLHYVNVTQCNIKKSQGYELHSRSCIGAGAADTSMSSEARDSVIRRESTAVI